jgi:hypothetical protein
MSAHSDTRCHTVASSVESLLHWLSQLEHTWPTRGNEQNPYVEAANTIRQLSQELIQAKRQRNDEQRLRLAAERGLPTPEMGNGARVGRAIPETTRDSLSDDPKEQSNG